MSKIHFYGRASGRLSFSEGVLATSTAPFVMTPFIICDDTSTHG